ncbi:MAG: TonB-dependent receptor, partial [Candidatus Neomarinimicrobiota bacterium]
NISNTIVDARCDSCSINETLNLILLSTDLTWEKNNIQFIIKEKESISYYKISGRVIDKTTNSPIPHTNIFISNSSLGDISNHNGIFSISNIYTKSCSLIISYIGYDRRIIELQFPNDDKKDYEIPLLPKVLSTKEISIFGLPKEFMDRSKNPGQVSFSPRHISTLPNLGEIDIFRSLQFLPGVQLGLGETSELYIRGGSPDQNLVLLDWMPIYQTGHMFGFISGISANAVKDVQVYKGSIPPKYGGKISSVIDISSKTGNVNNIRGAMYGNLMSQGILTEIPILKRGSYIINIRKSNPSNGYSKLYNAIQDYVTGNDQFNLLNESASKESNQNTYYDIWSSYEDVIGKISLLINPMHRFTITHINGVDSVLENREYFGFNTILGSDSVEIKENSHTRNKGLILNLFSNWNSNYNSHLSIYQNKVDINYTSMLRPKSSGGFYSNINEAEEDNKFLDRSVRFHQEYNGINKHKISAGFQENFFQLRRKVDFKDGSSNNSYITSE